MRAGAAASGRAQKGDWRQETVWSPHTWRLTSACPTLGLEKSAGLGESRLGVEKAWLPVSTGKLVHLFLAACKLQGA